MNVLYFHPYYSPDFRPIIFLITSVCAGLPALVWAFRLHLHRGRISAFIVLLLLIDLIQLSLNLYTVTQLVTKLYWTPELFQFWSGLNWCGFQLHQLVALEGVLTQKYPQFSARICSMPCYFIIFILVLVFSTVSGLTAHNPVFAPFLFSLGTSLAPLSLLVTCKAPPVSKNAHSVFIVAIVTSVMLYLPFMLIICMKFFISSGVPPSWYVMSVCLMDLRVISDPLLCVLVCRGNLRDVQTTPKTYRILIRNQYSELSGCH